MKIINKAKKENRKKGEGIYYEKHHILPKSMFPLWSDRESNLVFLTAREHFFCHKLLSKIYDNDKMFIALFLMSNVIKENKHILYRKSIYSFNKKEYPRLSCREYEKIKLDYIKRVYCEDSRYYKETINKMKIKMGDRVRCIETNEIFISQKEASEKMNINRSSIIRNLKGEYESAGGYHFEYVDNNKKRNGWSEDKKKEYKKRRSKKYLNMITKEIGTREYFCKKYNKSYREIRYDKNLIEVK